MPSRDELMEDYGVRGVVAQNALKLLRDDGVVDGNPATGHAVCDTSSPAVTTEIPAELAGLRQRITRIEHRLNHPDDDG